MPGLLLCRTIELRRDGTSLLRIGCHKGLYSVLTTPAFFLNTLFPFTGSLFLEYLDCAAIAEPMTTRRLYGLSEQQLTLGTAVLGNVLRGVPFELRVRNVVSRHYSRRSARASTTTHSRQRKSMCGA